MMVVWLPLHPLQQSTGVVRRPGRAQINPTNAVFSQRGEKISARFEPAETLAPWYRRDPMYNRTLKKYRLRCETEQNYVYVWAESEPDACPNGADHVIEEGSAVELESVSDDEVVVRNLPLTPFDRIKTAADCMQLNLKPGNGVSKLRDIVRKENGGIIVNAIESPVYEFRATGANAIAYMRSAERCRCMAGAVGEVAIGGHIARPLAQGQRLRFGLFDDKDGYFFEIESNTLSVNVMHAGRVSRATRDKFNIDALDGNGPSGHIVNPFKGYDWSISFGMYGYGAVEFSIVAEDFRQYQRSIVMHRYHSQNEPSVASPNLPINVQLDTGPDVPADSEALVYVTGRKYSVQGKFRAATRTGAAIRMDAVAGEGWVPVMSISKAKRPSVAVQLHDVEVICESGTSLFRVATGSQVPSDAEWGAPDGYDPSETVVDVCTSSEVTGGTCVWTGFARSDTVASQPRDLDFYLIEDTVVTVYVRDPAGLGKIGTSVTWSEEW